MSLFQYDPLRADRRRRPYQKTCERNIAENLNPCTPTLLHMATGGGKTFVANNALKAELSRSGGYALWVTKDWLLLQQAADDLAARHSGMATRLARLGGSRNAGDIGRLPEVTDTNRVRVVYTTLHTFKMRRDQGRLPRRKPKLIVWDECHWGYAASTGKALLKWARERHIPVLGLTATPRQTGQFKIACSHTFSELVKDEFLADYELKGCRTNVGWSPQLAGERGDFTPSSLSELAASPKRNDLIVNEYVNNAGEYGKTVIFACNIRHADRLAHLLKVANISARPFHSQIPPRVRQETLRQFSAPGGEIRVLVNVAMFTHGVDVPDIKTVFLCRPTASDILFSQMVGRGARRTSEKDGFYLVEFTDNANRFLPEVVTAKKFFGAPIHAGGNARRRNRPWRHRFNSVGAPAWTGTQGPKAVRDLWYLEGQTFGVEFELTADIDPKDLTEEEWLPIALGLLARLRDRLGPSRVRPDAEMDYHTEGYDKWKVEYDRSVGWEVVSPILEGKNGFIELANACAVLTAAADDLGLRVNYRTGTHVHIGWITSRDRAIRALRLVHLLEPMLRSLVPPSRFAAFDPVTESYDPRTPNDYCRPVKDVYKVHDFDGDTTLDDVEHMADGTDARFVTFNPTPLWESPETPHVEIRLLGGTTEAEKVLPWISLWMRLLRAADQGRDLSRYDFHDPAANFPTLDIHDMLNIVDLPDESDKFEQRLRQRQEDVFSIWRRHDELHDWLPAAHPKRERRPFIRSHEDIIGTLEDSKLAIPDTGAFVDLDDQGRLCALWCVLLGEGPLPAGQDATVFLCAERLHSEGWADYRRRPRKGSRLYKAIRNTLDTADSDGWFDVPGPGLVRAFVGIEASTPSPANRVLDQGGWQDCVLRAMSQQEGGRAPRWLVGRTAFDVAREYYGIQIQTYVRSVEEPIEDAIDSAVEEGLIAIDQSFEAATDDDSVLVLLVKYRVP